MQLDNARYLDIKKAFLAFEKEYNVEIVIAALGGSTSIGTNNSLSDLDIYVIYSARTILPRKIRYKTPDNSEIHIISCEVSEVINTMHEYNKEVHLYPSYLNRTKEEMELNQKLTMYDRKDYPRSMIYYTMMADVVWNLNVSFEECYEKFKEGLVVSDVLDFYYTKTHGNYDHFIYGKDDVYARKYITTVQEILYCRWMCDKRTIPPMDINDLLIEYGDSCTKEQQEEINKVYEANFKTTEDKFKAVVPASAILNEFIITQLNDMKEKFELLSNRYFTI